MRLVNRKTWIPASLSFATELLLCPQIATLVGVQMAPMLCLFRSAAQIWPCGRFIDG
jgi:hypothetical protein